MVELQEDKEGRELREHIRDDTRQELDRAIEELRVAVRGTAPKRT